MPPRTDELATGVFAKRRKGYPAVALSVVAFVLQLSALGVPLLVWAMVGAVRWLVVAQRTAIAPLLGPLDRT